jgi:anaerobic magnesium-protoporphyrin IX monomethyl ester cyclase
LKALLIYPPTGLFDRTDRCQTPLEFASAQGARPPMDLAYMAASLEAEDVECHVRDYPMHNGSWEGLRAELRELRPDWLFFSITSFSFNADCQAARIAREELPQIRTVAKGAHFKMHGTDMLRAHPELDVAITGECELAAGEIARHWGDLGRVEGIAFRGPRGLVQTQPRRVLEEMDRLPLPARHLLDNRLYTLPGTGEPLTMVLASRGCPHHCIFCLVPSVSGNRVHARSPQHLLEELRECVHKHGIRHILFKADLFTADRRWVEELCDAIAQAELGLRWICNSRVDTIDLPLARKMRAAGCWLVAMGVESGNQEMLRLMKKATDLSAAKAAVDACRSAGIETFLYFTIGHPWDNRETVLQTFDFARRLDGDWAEFQPCVPFPGTELHSIATRDGLLSGGEERGEGVSPLAFSRTYALGVRELNRLRLWGLARFYLRPRFWARLVRKYPPSTLCRFALAGLRSLGATARLMLRRAEWQS